MISELFAMYQFGALLHSADITSSKITNRASVLANLRHFTVYTCLPSGWFRGNRSGGCRRMSAIGFILILSTLLPLDAEWLSGRMPDSRAREHRHESSYGLHIGAVDGKIIVLVTL